MIAALAISIYLACNKPQYVYVEKDGKEIWLQVEMLDTNKNNPLDFNFRLNGTEEEIDFHNLIMKELEHNKQNVNVFIDPRKCYKI